MPAEFRLAAESSTDALRTMAIDAGLTRARASLALLSRPHATPAAAQNVRRAIDALLHVEAQMLARGRS